MNEWAAALTLAGSVLVITGAFGYQHIYHPDQTDD
jgi:hypothetical protein